MWLIELAFTAAPERLAARPAHRARLTALHQLGMVTAAGPLADDSGALIIVDVPDRPAVEALIGADPYFSTEGVAITDVREWRPLPFPEVTGYRV